LEVAQKVADQIENLRKRSHSGTKTDVIRKALALFQLFIEESESGASVIFRYKNGKEERLRILH
jgi:plasmid stabilization system protein ParE